MKTDVIAQLSEAEQALYRHLLTSIDQKNLAADSNVSYSMMNKQTRLLYMKLGVSSRTELMAREIARLQSR